MISSSNLNNNKDNELNNNNNSKLHLNLNSAQSSNSNLFKLMKTKSIKKLFLSTGDFNNQQSNSTNSTSPTSSTASSGSNDLGDQRTMDAADTLVSLAHSASSTPTTEFKPFIQPNQIQSQIKSNNNIEIVLNTSENQSEVIEKTFKLDEIIADKINPTDSTNDSSSKNSKEMVESACKILLEQVLKSCPNVNLSSITIKATAVPSNSSNTSSSLPSSTSNQSNLIKSPKRNSELESGKLVIDSNVKNMTTVLGNNKKPRLNSNTKNDKSPLDKLSLNILTNESDSDSDSDSQTSLFNSTRPAPTLATGRRSKDIELPPDESKKRQERRERNKEAAARCRRRREELTHTLSQKTNELTQEQENLRKNYIDLMNQKQNLEKFFNEHVKNCQAQNIIKAKKEDLNEIIKQSNEKIQKNQKFFHTEDIQTQAQSTNINVINNNSTTISSVAMTPNSAGFMNVENFMNQVEQQQQQQQQNDQKSQIINNPQTNSLTRPNNLNLKNSNTNQLNSLITPSSASLTSVLQGIAFALGHHSSTNSNNNPNSFSIGSNNNISLLMTPTFQLNTPTAFLSLTPIEATLNAFNSCNTPMILQQNPILSVQHNQSNEITNTSNNSLNNAGSSLKS